MPPPTTSDTHALPPNTHALPPTTIATHSRQIWGAKPHRVPMHERHCGISYHCRARVHTLLCCLKEDVRGASTDLRQQRRLLQLRPRDGERRRSLLLGLMSTYREHLAHTRAANEFFGGQNCGKRTCSKATQMRSITPILAAGESSSEALTAGTSSAATIMFVHFIVVVLFSSGG